MTNNQAADLAKSMNVSEADLMCFARSVANSIEQDKAADGFVACTEQEQVEIAQAYAAHAVKKVESFTAAYLTNPEAKKAFQDSIHASLVA